MGDFLCLSTEHKVGFYLEAIKCRRAFQGCQFLESELPTDSLASGLVSQRILGENLLLIQQVGLRNTCASLGKAWCRNILLIYIQTQQFSYFAMTNTLNKGLQIFRASKKTTPMFSQQTCRNKNQRYYQSEPMNQSNPISIKSLTISKADVSITAKGESRCRSAINQPKDTRTRKQRAAAGLNQRPKQSQGPTSPKAELQAQQLIECKQLLKKPNDIYQDRRRMLSSIQSKLVQEMRSKVVKRSSKKKATLDADEKQSAFRPKSSVKFNDLMRIKHLQLQRDTQKREKKMKKLFANKIYKKESMLSRTQPSFENPNGMFKGVYFGNPWRLFSQSFGRLCVKQQELTGWEASVYE